MVRVSAGALPPPFALEVVWSAALAEDSLRALPLPSRLLEAPCAPAELRVGLAAQAADFWAEVLPDAALRSLVAPEHFELSADGPGLLLRSLAADSSPSAPAVSVNGKALSVDEPSSEGGATAVTGGDVIGIGTTTQPSVLHFRIIALGCDGDGDDGAADGKIGKPFAAVGVEDLVVFEPWADELAEEPPTYADRSASAMLTDREAVTAATSRAVLAATASCFGPSAAAAAAVITTEELRLECGSSSACATQ